MVADALDPSLREGLARGWRESGGGRAVKRHPTRGVNGWKLMFAGVTNGTPPLTSHRFHG